MPLLKALSTLPAHGAADPLRRVQHLGAYALPVFSFGAPAKAKVATISINPSVREFLGPKRTELGARRQRFTAPWLAGSTFTRAEAQAIQADCDNYFLRVDWRGRRTFYSWFHAMERLVNLSSPRLSYLTGEVCHLDLSPWASDPVWRFLSPEEKSEHLKLGVPVLLYQLGFANGDVTAPRSSTIRKILLNGVTTSRAVLTALGQRPAILDQKSVSLTSASGKKTILELTRGTVIGIDFVAWNIPLAQPFGNLAMRHIASSI